MDNDTNNSEPQTNQEILDAQAAGENHINSELPASDIDAPTESVDLSSQEHVNTTDAARTEPIKDDTEYATVDDYFDVFHWANEIDEVKNNVSVELFLFNKNYTPFRQSRPGLNHPHRSDWRSDAG